MKSRLEELTEEHWLFTVISGIGNPEFDNYLRLKIKEFEQKEKKKKKKEQKGQFLKDTELDLYFKKKIVESMSHLDNGNISFIPDDDTIDEFIRYYEESFNESSKSFFTDILPAIYDLLGVNIDLYQSTPIRYMDARKVRMSEYTSEFYDNQIEQLRNKKAKLEENKNNKEHEYLKSKRKNVLSKKDIEHLISVPAYSKIKIDLSRTNNELEELIKEKEFLLQIIKEEPEVEVKGLNLVYYTTQRLDQDVVFIATKTKDMERRASKIRSNLLDLYDMYLKASRKRSGENMPSLDDIAHNLRVVDGKKRNEPTLKDVVVTDNRGIEVMFKEGHEKDYERIFFNRFVKIEEKSEDDLEGMKRATKEGIDPFPEYKDRFKHKRVKIYDTKTGIIIDAHFTNFISKNLKDSHPILSHPARTVKNEIEQNDRHELSFDIKQRIKSFFQEMRLLRGFPYELKYFSIIDRKERSNYLINTLNNELRANFTTLQLDGNENENISGILSIDPVYKNKTQKNRFDKSLNALGLEKSSLSELQRKLNLSVLIDLFIHDINDCIWENNQENIFSETKAGYVFSDTLTDLFDKGFQASKIHGIIYNGTDEDRDWGKEKETIGVIHSYLMSLRDKKNTVRKLLSSSLASQDLEEALSKLDEVYQAYGTFKMLQTNRECLIRQDRQVQVDIMARTLDTYNRIFDKYGEKAKPLLESSRTKIIGLFYEFEKKIGDLRSYLSLSQLNDYKRARDVFKGNYDFIIDNPSS